MITSEPAPRKASWTVYREILLFAALALVTAGVTLMVRSGFGISVASSMPYVFSLHFTQLSFGTWTFIAYTAVFLLMLVLIRHFEWIYMISFAMSFIVGLFSDLFKFLWSFLPEIKPLFIVYYLVGWCLLSLGIASFIKSGLPPAPYELFIREISRFKNIPVSRAKTYFDIGCLTTSLLFLLLVVRQFVGIGIGTVVAGLLNGTVVGFWLKAMNKQFEMKVLFSFWPIQDQSFS